MAIFTYKEALEKHGVKSDSVKSIGVNPASSPQTGVLGRTLRDIPSDLLETGKGIFEAGKGVQKKITEAITTPGLSLPQRAVGALVAPFQGVARTASELATGSVKLFTTDEFEKAVTSKIQEGGQAVASSDFSIKIRNFYDALPDSEKFTLTNIIAPIAEVMGTVGTGGASGLATGAVRQGVKGAVRGVAGVADGVSLSVIPKTIKGAGSQLYKSAITPNVDEAKAILRYRADTPFLTRLGEFGEKAPLTRGQTALEQGLIGTESMVGVQARRKADALWKSEIEPLVANSKVQMTKDELFTPALERIVSIEDPTRRKAMEDAFEALLEDFADYPDTVDLVRAQALKRDLAKFTPTKIFKGKEVANEMRTIQADIASAIRTKTYNSFPEENIRKKYLDWANLDELEDLGIKAISEGSFKGGSGTLLSGIWDMATTPIKTIGGQFLYRVGSAFEFTAPKGIKTMGQYMESQGYKRPIIIPVSPAELEQ